MRGLYTAYLHGCGDAINILNEGSIFKREKSTWEELNDSQRLLQILPGVLITASCRGEETAKLVKGKRIGIGEGICIDVGKGGNYQDLNKGVVSLAARKKDISQAFSSTVKNKNVFLHTVIASSGGTGSSFVVNNDGFLPAENGHRELLFLIRNTLLTHSQRENLLLTKQAVYEKLESLPQKLTVVEFINKGSHFPYRYDNNIVGTAFCEILRTICYKGKNEPENRFDALSSCMWYATCGYYPTTATLADTYERAVKNAISNAKDRILTKDVTLNNAVKMIALLTVPMFDHNQSKAVVRRMESIAKNKEFEIFERVVPGLEYAIATVLMNFPENNTPDAVEVQKIKEEKEIEKGLESLSVEEFNEMVSKSGLKGYMEDYLKELGTS